MELQTVEEAATKFTTST